MVGGEGTERPDIVLGDVAIGWFVRAQEVKDPINPESGDGVEGETLAQVVGLIEAVILDAGADLQRMEERSIRQRGSYQCGGPATQQKRAGMTGRQAIASGPARSWWGPGAARSRLLPPCV